MAKEKHTPTNKQTNKEENAQTPTYQLQVGNK
jgi:hypothetical protein